MFVFIRNSDLWSGPDVLFGYMEMKKCLEATGSWSSMALWWSSKRSFHLQPHGNVRLSSKKNNGHITLNIHNENIESSCSFDSLRHSSMCGPPASLPNSSLLSEISADAVSMVVVKKRASPVTSLPVITSENDIKRGSLKASDLPALHEPSSSSWMVTLHHQWAKQPLC